MTPLEAINYILSNSEKEIFNEYRKIEAIFMDLCIDNKYTQEVNTLLVAVKMRVPSKMLEKDKVDGFFEQNSVAKMVADYGVKRELAVHAINTWSDGLYSSKKSYKESNTNLKELKNSAAKGDKDKQFELGKAYLKGFVAQGDVEEIIEKDLQKAFNYFMMSAKSGHVAAKNYVGLCYDQGIGVSKDHKKAKTFYEASSKQGNLNALYNLANCYEYGIGIEQNESKSFEKYKELYEKGFVEAIYKMAWFYENGIAVNVDKRRALNLYKEAAEKGSSHAQYYLAQSYQYPVKGQPNVIEAKKWYYLAAKNKHPEANFHLSQL